MTDYIFQQINKLKEFVEENYKDQLITNLQKGHMFLVIDFAELTRFDPELATLLLDDPSETIKATEIAVEQIPDIEGKKIKVRFRNLSDAVSLTISDSRSVHLNKFITITAEVLSKSKVYIDRVSARFECPSCGNQINVLQLKETFEEPTLCGCGRKGRFLLKEKELSDIQELSVMDSVDHQQEGDVYQELVVLLKEDLTNADINRNVLIINNTVKISGYYEELEITTRTGKKLRRMDKVFIANHIESAEDQRKDFYPTAEETKMYKEQSSDPKFYYNLIQGFSPTIYGHSIIKETMLLQLVGGVRRQKHGNTFRRGDIHLGLVGDPGQGKTELILRTVELLPRSRFVSGKGSSAVGLGGGTKKNAIVEGNTAEPGALAMAHKSILGIDEIDKMNEEDLDALNNGMEQQFITIDKSGVHARYDTRTRVTIGANPKNGRFDTYSTIADQFGMKPSLLSRLDIVFPIKDTPDEEKDTKLAEHILNVDTASIIFSEEENIFYNTNHVRKFIQSVTNLEPEFPQEMLTLIRDYYVKMRMANRRADGTIPAVAIGPRQLQSIERFAEAHAKIFFREKVIREDVDTAFRLIGHYLETVCKDPETGMMDIDRISSSVTASQRSKLHELNLLIQELEGGIGKIIPIEDVIAAALGKNISESDVEELLTKLKKVGDIMEPRKGFISRIT